MLFVIALNAQGLRVPDNGHRKKARGLHDRFRFHPPLDKTVAVAEMGNRIAKSGALTLEHLRRAGRSLRQALLSESGKAQSNITDPALCSVRGLAYEFQVVGPSVSRVRKPFRG